MSFTYDNNDPRTVDEQLDAYIAALPKYHPERIKYAASFMPWKDSAKFDLAEYCEAIAVLRKRGYSYAEIAKWLGEKIGAPNLNRGHVYRAFQQWSHVDEEAFNEAEERGEVRYLPPEIPLAEAEKKAAQADEEKEP